MSAPLQGAVRNRLLAMMTAEDFARLAPHFELVRLSKGAVLTETDAVIEHAYFPEKGIGSIIAVSPEGLEVEAGLFGRDGMAPTPLLMDANTSANRILFQVQGESWRIGAAELLAAVEASPGLRRLLLRYAQTMAVQTSFTALSNAVHHVDERLARWILMCDDRVDSGEMSLTHEFLSIMLAVRRPSVTTALHVLEGNGLIRSERGCLVVRDRTALEQFAGDAYGKPEAVYRDLIGSMS